jgi:ferredoxin
MPNKPSSVVNIFDLMSEDNAEEEKKKRRAEQLEPTHTKDLFKEGNLNINKYTCLGVQCKLCIKVCPTNALYWKTGEVGIIDDLCVHCGACVLNCMVDNCMKIQRTREDGTVETFSNPKEYLALQQGIGGKKRAQRVKEFLRSQGKLR